MTLQLVGETSNSKHGQSVDHGWKSQEACCMLKNISIEVQKGCVLKNTGDVLDTSFENQWSESECRRFQTIVDHELVQTCHCPQHDYKEQPSTGNNPKYNTTPSRNSNPIFKGH